MRPLRGEPAESGSAGVEKVVLRGGVRRRVQGGRLQGGVPAPVRAVQGKRQVLRSLSPRLSIRCGSKATMLEPVSEV